MKKVLKKLLTIVLALTTSLTCFATVGCGGTSSDYDYLFTRDDGDLYVRYFKGGNGAEWLYKIADDFVKETGIQVYLECDDEITEQIPITLKNAHPSNGGTPSQSILAKLPDVCMTQTMRWQEYVNKGWISNIDEVYTYEYANEGNKTLEDKLIEGADKFGYMGQTPDLATEGDKHYWVVPWTVPVTGIVYNVDLLKGLGGKWADGYVPKTVTELFELVSDLNTAGITPFAWGGDGTNIGYWNFLFMGLWTSYQGYKTGYQNGRAEFGGIQDFYDFVDSDGKMDEGYEAFNQAGRKIGLRILQSLIADFEGTIPEDSTNYNGGWKNSIKDPVSKTIYEAQDKFAFGEAAMIPSGAWIKNEIAESIDETFHYAMMPTPAVDLAYVQSVASELGLDPKEIHGGLLEDGTFETASTVDPQYAQVNNTEIGDIMFIPQNAVNKVNAVKFLQFVNRQENVEYATEVMGIARPFKYKPSECEINDNFTKSVFNIYEKENAVQFIRISESSIFTYAGIKEYAEHNEADILLQLNSKSITQLCQGLYDNAKDNYEETWRVRAGLD